MALGLTGRRRPPLLDAGQVHAIHIRFFFIRPRKGVRHKVGLTLDVPYIRRIFRYAAKLILLTNSLGIGFLMDGWHKTLVVCVKGKSSTLNHIPKVSGPFVGGQQFPIIWRPLLLIRLQL